MKKTVLVFVFLLIAMVWVGSARFHGESGYIPVWLELTPGYTKPLPSSGEPERGSDTLLPEPEMPATDRSPKEPAPETGFPGGSGPIAYLTFDDGPSKNTLTILETLESFGIHATFFVTGNNVSGDPDIYRRIAAGGHVLANHTYSHNFEKIYLSVDDFMADFLQLEEFLYRETGLRTDLMRFPGGSKSGMAPQVSGYDIIMDLINEITMRGYDYFDWNVSSGDGTKNPARTEIVANVLQKADQVQGDIVVLFHDSGAKVSTAEALPEVIEGLLERGYEFAPLTSGAIDIKHKRAEQ